VGRLSRDPKAREGAKSNVLPSTQYNP